MRNGSSTKKIGTQIIRFRLIILNIIIVVLVTVLLSQLFYLQALNTQEYKREVKNIIGRQENIQAPRGEIFDRNSDTPFAYNSESISVLFTPGEVDREELPSVLVRLSEFLGIPLADLQKMIPDTVRYDQIEIKKDIAREKIYYLAEHIEDFPGTTWVSKLKRRYDEIGSLSHIIGYVSLISQDEYYQLSNKGYSDNTIIGKSGIEKVYDYELKGSDGIIHKTVDVKGKKVADSEITPAVPGNNIVLTIDRKIQKLAQDALGKRKGVVIVLKPASGELLAMVSYPWFDPSLFYSEEDKKIKEMQSDPNSPLMNRAIQSRYPPASVFKIVLTTALAEEGNYSIYNTVLCNGFLKLGRDTFNCWKKTGHGYMDLKKGLANSCDVYFWRIGLDALGPDTIAKYAQKFGLGQITGVDLPYENKGLIPSPAWKKKMYGVKWLGGDTLNFSIGQGWTEVTPLQIADMVAMVVNQGVIYKPHLVKEIRDFETGNLIEKIEPEVLHSVDIKDSTFKTVQEAMRMVVTEGTCRYVITTNATDIAAKTGTGEIGVEGKFHSWFVAYAPYSNVLPEDQIVLVVLVEAKQENREWEWWAPKAGNAILHGIFKDMTYEEVTEDLNLWYLKENLQELKQE